MVRVPDAKSDCSRRGEAEVRIINFKTTWSEFPWSEFQQPSQTATSSKANLVTLTPLGSMSRGEAKLRTFVVKEDKTIYLNNYFNFHVCLSIRDSVFPCFRPCVRKLTPVSAVGSQNVTNRSFLVSVKSEKYAFWITLRPQSDHCRQGKAEVCILDFKTTWSEFQKAC